MEAGRRGVATAAANSGEGHLRLTQGLAGESEPIKELTAIRLGPLSQRLKVRFH